MIESMIIGDGVMVIIYKDRMNIYSLLCEFLYSKPINT